MTTATAPETATAEEVLAFFAPFLHPFGPGGGFTDEARQIRWEAMHERMRELTGLDMHGEPRQQTADDDAAEAAYWEWESDQ